MIQRTFILRSEKQIPLIEAFIRANLGADRPLAVVVSEPRAKRTQEQNDALHALIRQIAAEAYVDGKQYSMTAWKEFFRDRFVSNDRIELPDGRTVMRHRSTTELSVGEMSELIDAIKSYAATELGLEVL